MRAFFGSRRRGVRPRAKTPAWLVDRLQRHTGQRPVNALVDISNYVMFEYGRPSHIFDLDKIHDQLVVRWAGKGRVVEAAQRPDRRARCPGRRDRRRASGRVVGRHHGRRRHGGADETRNVYVEAAFWWPDAVSGRSRRFGFSTDAGHRFERGVDAATTVEHIERITALVIADVRWRAPGRSMISSARCRSAGRSALRVARAAKVIGMPVTQAECAGVFTGPGAAVQRARGQLTVTPPSLALDLQIEEDLIEEVIRVLGYESCRRRRRWRRSGASDSPRRVAARMHVRRALAAARLPGDDQLQLRRGRAGSASWQATTTRSGC